MFKKIKNWYQKMEEKGAQVEKSNRIRRELLSKSVPQDNASAAMSGIAIPLGCTVAAVAKAPIWLTALAGIGSFVAVNQVYNRLNPTAGELNEMEDVLEQLQGELSK